jgi:hypothetical protein
MSGCVDCGAPTPNRQCRKCSLMDRAEEMAALEEDRDEDGESR